MLRIRDVYPGSWFLPISDPGSLIPDLWSRICDPGSVIPDLWSRICDPGSVIPDLWSRISDPGSVIPDLWSRIPDLWSRICDPGSRIPKQQQKRGVKKINCHSFLCSHKFLVLCLRLVFLKGESWLRAATPDDSKTPTPVSHNTSVVVWNLYCVRGHHRQVKQTVKT